MRIDEFLLARIAEDEAAARPRTVGLSGGTPNPWVPNCFGQAGCRWRIKGPDMAWLHSDAVQDEIRAHEWTHADARQRRALAECEAKRRIVEDCRDILGGLDKREQAYHHEAGNEGPGLAADTMRALAQPYAEHSDFRQEWAI